MTSRSNWALLIKVHFIVCALALVAACGLAWSEEFLSSLLSLALAAGELVLAFEARRRVRRFKAAK